MRTNEHADRTLALRARVLSKLRVCEVLVNGYLPCDVPATRKRDGRNVCATHVRMKDPQYRVRP